MVLSTHGSRIQDRLLEGVVRGESLALCPPLQGVVFQRRVRGSVDVPAEGFELGRLFGGETRVRPQEWEGGRGGGW